MFTGGISQGILNGMQANRDNAAQATDLAYKKQLMAMQAIALDNARSQQAKSQQWDQMAGYEDAFTPPPAPQPPALGQASVPMQQAPQGPPQGQPQSQAPGGIPPGLMNGMGMQGPPPGAPPQQMAPPQGAPMPPAQPAPPQQAAPPAQIPPYQSMQAMQQRQQQEPQQAPVPMAPPPTGAAGGGMPAPGSMQGGSPFQSADTTPEQASQAAAAQIMKLATGPDSYTVMKQNVMKHLIANGVPPQQADQQAAQYLANSPAAQTKLKAMEAQRQEALQITEKAQSAADAAYKAVLLKQSQAETQVRDKNTAEYQKGELGVQQGNLGVARGRLALEREKDAASRGSGVDAKDLPARGAMAATGMPLSQVIPGYGKEAVAAREKVQSEAIKQIKADNPGMSDIDAGREYANRTVDYAGGKRSVGQLDTMLGATRAAVDQLDFNIGQAKKAMAGLTSSNLSPIVNSIARGEEKWTGDPKYSSLYYYMNGVATEAARLQSGGQASAAQLHQGAAEEAQKWMNMNMTPASFNEVADAIKAEGKNRIENYEKAKEKQRPGKAREDAPAAGGIPAGWSIKEVK